MKRFGLVLGLLRVGFGWIFLWGFLDKTFGLGFATEPDKAWLVGGSPTTGFLKFATQGPLAGFYQNLAGNAFVDWLFMMGLLLIGLALWLGILVRVASVSAIVLMLLMYTAAMPPENNPVLDEHIMYALLFVAFLLVPVGNHLGLGRWWSSLPLVRSFSWLR